MCRLRELWKKLKKKTEEEKVEDAEEEESASWNGGAIRKDGGNVFVEKFKYAFKMVVRKPSF